MKQTSALVCSMCVTSCSPSPCLLLLSDPTAEYKKSVLLKNQEIPKKRKRPIA